MLICGGCKAEIHGHHDQPIRIGDGCLFVVCKNCGYRINVSDDVAVILYGSIKTVLSGIVRAYMEEHLAELKTEEGGG